VDVKAALAALGCDNFSVVSKLSENWHGDAHWHVRDPAGNRFSLRAVTFGREIRWEETRRHDLSVLTAQMAAADAFVAAGIPFMPRVGETAVVGSSFVAMFGWLDGVIATIATPDRAFAIGQLLRRIHDLGLPVDDRLPEHDAAAAAERSLHELQQHGIADASFVVQVLEMVARIRSSQSSSSKIVVQGDCNFPNVLWSGDAVTGIVDFDQIGISDPVEELGWVTKWWSRPRGVADLSHDARLARDVLEGYGDEGVDRDALAAVLWVTGCVNANSVLHMLHSSADARPVVLAGLRERADTLAAMVR
jgi:Ser/Thr protein kinase RdoA (MazF antagonist)